MCVCTCVCVCACVMCVCAYGVHTRMAWCNVVLCTVCVLYMYECFQCMCVCLSVGVCVPYVLVGIKFGGLLEKREKLKRVSY